MQDVIALGKRTLSLTVVVTTIAWAMGLSMLLVPLTVSAATAGSLVKASGAAVYYVGSDGKRYVFPDEKTYWSWYSDFNSVVTISDAELAAMAIGGNVTYRPGKYMVKITTDPKVYAVDANGTLRWVKTEDAAKALYGADWNKMVRDVPDAFFVNYRMGTDINVASDFSPAAVMAAVTDINKDRLGSSVGTGTGAVSGSLMISMNASSPSAATLPRGATGVNYLTFDVKNTGSAAANLTELVVQRSGAGSPADFINVYVYSGSQRLTTGRTINTTTNQAVFGSLNVAIDAGATKTLWLSAEMGGAAVAGAGNVNNLSIMSAKSGGAAIAGTPVQGANFTLSGAVNGSMTFSRSGAIPLANVKSGALNQKVAEYRVDVGAVEDVDLKWLALFRGGAVGRQFVSNFVLKQAGLVLASTSGYDSTDRAVFVLASPLRMERGSGKLFEVYADISPSARSGAAETILSYLDQSVDASGIGVTYGVGARVLDGVAPAGYLGLACALGAGGCSSTRIEQGQLTFSSLGPVARDVAINGRDVEALRVQINNPGSALEVRNTSLTITAAVGTGAALGAANGLINTAVAPAVQNFTDIKMSQEITAAATTRNVLATFADLALAGADAAQVVLSTDSYTIPAGATMTLVFTVDVSNVALMDGNTLALTLNAFPANAMRVNDSSTFLAAGDIVGTPIAGNANPLRAASLTIATASVPVANTYIQGGKDLAVMGVRLVAGQSSKVRVTNIALQSNIDDVVGSGFTPSRETVVGNDVATLVLTSRLWNGAVQLGEVKQPTASGGAVGVGGVLTFDNLNLEIPAGATINLVLTVNLASALPGLTDGLQFQVTAAASVTAVDVDGNAVVPLAAAFPVVGPAHIIAPTGAVTVAAAPIDNDTQASIVVAGKQKVILGKVRISAAFEALRATRLAFSTGAPGSVSALYLADGNTIIGGPVAPAAGTGITNFVNLANFTIPKDSSKTLTILGDLNTVSAGLVSGANAVITVRDGFQAGIIDGNVEFRGDSPTSSTLISEFGVAGATNDFALERKIGRKTQGLFSLAALPTTVLSAGTQVAYRFKVAADPAEQVSYKKFTFEVTKTAAPTIAVDGAATSSVRRVGDSVNLAGISAAAGVCGAGAAGVCTVTVDFTGEAAVGAGTTNTFDLRLIIGGAIVTGNSIFTRNAPEAGVVLITGAPSLGVVGGAVVRPGWSIDATNDAVANAAAAAATALNIWCDNSATPALRSDVFAGATTFAVGAVSADCTNFLDVILPDNQTMAI